MYKEAFLVIGICILLYFILRFLLSKKPQIFRVSIISILVVCTSLNVWFLFANYLPAFVLDGTTPLGDMEGNLLLYKADSEYRSHIIFPIIEDRTVYLDTASDTYRTFYETYAATVVPFSLSEEDKQLLTDASLYQHHSEFYLFKLLDYVFPANDDYSLPSCPSFHAYTEELNGETALVSFCTAGETMYLLPLHVYETITKHTLTEP